ncbi:hypothetical protein HDV06_000119 [Boothiomyces sp. JEL0866]|nr:hypothetical protein HDV06_000119 [Boothiomyces sp. JEL0866]
MKFALKRRKWFKYILILLIAAFVLEQFTAIKRHWDRFTKYSIRKPKIPFDISEQDRVTLSYQPDHNPGDFFAVGNYLRTYQKYHENIWSQVTINNTDADAFQPEFNIIEAGLLGFIRHGYNSSIHLRQSYAKKGIVMCVNNRYTTMAYATAQIIRKVYNSTLPIEVFYIGDNDLNESNRKWLMTVSNLRVIDLSIVFDNSILSLDGWEAKPFAMLVSSFEQVIMMDADTVFLQPPEIFFEGELYKTHGALFFRDRPVFPASVVSVLAVQSLFGGTIPEKMASNPILSYQANHFQESGLIVLNKSMGFVGLLATCALNTGLIKNEMYKLFHGDKETFWIGFTAVNADFEFEPSLPGSMGLADRLDMQNSKVCSEQMVHLAENGLPGWANGGLVNTKYRKGEGLGTFTHYNIGTSQSNYIFTGRSPNYVCVTSPQDAIPFSPVQQDYLQKATSFIQSEKLCFDDSVKE